MIDFDEPVEFKMIRFMKVMWINVITLGVVAGILTYTEHIHGDVAFWRMIMYCTLGGTTLNILIFFIAYIGSQARSKERLRQQMLNQEPLIDGDDESHEPIPGKAN